MRYIIYLTIALIPFLSGCSTSMGVAGDYRLNAQGNKGLAVLSVRLDDQCGTGINTFQLNYSKPATTEYPRFFILKDMFLKNDFENPPGFFYVQEPPAGQYAFTGISEVSPGMRQGAIQPPMTFRVDAGKAQYLGEMNVTFTCKDHALPCHRHDQGRTPTRCRAFCRENDQALGQGSGVFNFASITRKPVAG